MTIIKVEDEIMHYGTPRHSGRYPWGSGGNEDGSQRNQSFLGYEKSLRDQGLGEKERAEAMGLTTTELRARRSIELTRQKQADIVTATRLKDTGMSNVAIGKEMGKNESSVRQLLNPAIKDRSNILDATTKVLKDEVTKHGFLDVGVGIEHQLGVSYTRMKTALAALTSEGYKVHFVKIEQLGTGKQTTIRVLTKPGVSYSEVLKNKYNIKTIEQYSEDGGRTYFGLRPPTSIKSSRVGINYADQGGAAADGVIYVRPGVEDVSLGKASYAQVRIAVDGTHYLKGMAMYKDDLPAGVDLQFNTNKKDTGRKHDAMKELTDDPDNPFGSTSPAGVSSAGATIKRQHGHMNILNEEGDWNDWSAKFSSQLLSKQKPILAKQQLDMTYEHKKNELDAILKLTNPTVRKKLLDSFADSADSTAVHLKAAALPRSGSHVILPITTMKENEVYAPNFRNGEKVVLVRHPHGGPFEIPELTVNNKNPTAKKALGTAQDAVGIHPKVAQKLSGADFDGDHVLVIPNDSNKITTAPSLKGLENFDPMVYKVPKEQGATLTNKTKQREMGDVSNLITDMTIKKASNAELARAVRHSMVVIDAEKHNLDYKASAQVENIRQLKEKYQLKPDGKVGGAATLISRAGSETLIDQRSQTFRIDPVTGVKTYLKTGDTYVDKKGVTIVKKDRVKKLEATPDAHTLSSGTSMEKIYADHSNKLKALANQARKEMVATKSIPYSASANKAYSKEVASLSAKLNVALKNAPRERQAQVAANGVVHLKRQANPDMDSPTLKKIKSQALAEARTRNGAAKARVDITPEEWKAIQAGAITNHKLSQILRNADLDVVKEYAMPRTQVLMTSAKQARAQSMLASGYTQAQVADHLGVSLTTLKNSLS